MLDLDKNLKSAKTIGLCGHVRPDGDCIGSTLAVYNYIKDVYPDAKPMLFLENIPHIFQFLQRSEEVVTDYPNLPPFDLFIVLDCADRKRIGRAGGYYASAKRTICIDHHETNDAFADENHIEPNASSTCELVYGLLQNERINKEIAECLYTGIVHDTGVFQYSCTSKKTMRIAGDLMERGIDYSKIVQDTYFAKTYRQQQLLGRALVRSRLYLDGRCILSYLTKEEMEELDALPKDLEGIVSQLRETTGTKVAVFFYPVGEEEGFKFSTRGTDGRVNLAQFAQRFGGGGHERAAGFEMKGSVEEVRERVLFALSEVL